jgi:uncharacterized coiled-coil protein SlyX
MAGSVDDLERRVIVLEARMRASDAERATTNERLNVVIGTLDVVQDTLRDHGRTLAAHDVKLAEHDRRFDRIDAKLAEHDVRFDRIDDRLDMVVDWIQRQP